MSMVHVFRFVSVKQNMVRR